MPVRLSRAAQNSSVDEQEPKVTVSETVKAEVEPATLSEPESHALVSFDQELASAESPIPLSPFPIAPVNEPALRSPPIALLLSDAAVGQSSSEEQTGSKRTRSLSSDTPPTKRISLARGKPLKDSIRDTGTGLTPLARRSVSWSSPVTPRYSGSFSPLARQFHPAQILIRPLLIGQSEFATPEDREAIVAEAAAADDTLGKFVDQRDGYGAWDNMSDEKRVEERRQKRINDQKIED